MPRTGRRHQLRVHLAHIGYPIVGDYTYANDKLAHRMFLHAAALELPLRGLAPRGGGGGGGEQHQHADGGGREEMPVRALAPLAPDSWADSFRPTEPIRSPEAWPDAARLL
eukprot:2090079-Prymnesium_polylepis.1